MATPSWTVWCLSLYKNHEIQPVGAAAFNHQTMQVLEHGHAKSVDAVYIWLHLMQIRLPCIHTYRTRVVRGLSQTQLTS